MFTMQDIKIYTHIGRYVIKYVSKYVYVIYCIYVNIDIQNTVSKQSMHKFTSYLIILINLLTKLSIVEVS